MSVAHLILLAVVTVFAGLPAKAQDMAIQDVGDVVVASPAASAPAPAGVRWGRETYCPIIASAAALRGLPLDFFVRLIHQESGFNPNAVSPKGAQGIAQFMPDTARERGLRDAFDPFPAIHASAHLLADLRTQFGNLGLAAAAYNAGAQRVSDWLAGQRVLPGETRAYVTIVTGHPPDHWMEGKGVSETAVPATPSCVALARRQGTVRLARADGGEPPSRENWGPWGLQLAGDWSRPKAVAAYRRLQQKFAAVLGGREPMVMRQRMPGRMAPRYLVRVAESSRERANVLCARLIALGGACLVYKN